VGALIIVGALLCVAAPAAGHDLPRERTVLVEVSVDRIEAMVVYQEPPGRPVEFLVGRFDLDGDGELRGEEAKAAGAEWAPRALQGLVFEVDGQRLEPEKETQVKFRREHNGALSSAVLVTWSRTELESGGRRTVRIRRESDAGKFTTLLSFQVTSGLDAVSTPAEKDAPRVGPFELMPGDTHKFTARRPADQPPSLPTARP
jgi:hypothetical protein